MSSSTPPPEGSNVPSPGTTTSWRLVAWKLAIWGLFLALLYAVREFFFTAFLTFLFSYLTLAIVGRVMGRLSPGVERAWLRRLLTMAVFLLGPALLVGIGLLVGEPLMHQGQELVGWASKLDLEAEVCRLLESFIGPQEFRREYGAEDDPRYQRALEEFRNSGASHSAAYRDFPHLEAWVEGPVGKRFNEDAAARLRAHLKREGTSSKEFQSWFINQKFPELQAQARKADENPRQDKDPMELLALTAAKDTTTPAQLFERVRQIPGVLSALREEWLSDAVRAQLANLTESASYLKVLHEYYDQKRREAPSTLPYTFEEYLQLRAARPLGPKAFGDTLERLRPRPAADRDAKLRADFEAAKQHELFQAWWTGSTTGRTVHRAVDGILGVGSADHLDLHLAKLLSVPADVLTALLLSFFICIDFPNLRTGIQRLRHTWLREAYDEMAPAFARLAELIGRSMQAQGLIAFCNALLMFVAMSFLGVTHPMLLSCVVFVLCLVPTLGMFLSWVILMVITLIQPAGGLALALKTSAAVAVVFVIETFVLSPRILGRMMDLHPVMTLAILPIAQYFFGVWGLILATPVAVYVIHELILGRNSTLPPSE